VILTETTAFGIYDHNLVGLSQVHRGSREQTLWRVRPANIVLATGAIERPIPFASNDLPGIMSADAALAYLRRYAVVVGKRVLVATTNDTAYEVAIALAQAGTQVVIADYRRDTDPSRKFHDDRVKVLPARVLDAARGGGAVVRARLDDGTSLEVDGILVSGGWAPAVHLHSQAKGKLIWDEKRLAFLPGKAAPGIVVAGAATGTLSLTEALASGVEAACAIGVPRSNAPVSTGSEFGADAASPWTKRHHKGRVWVDYQNDVTATDIEIAARENFVSIEHLKRYTTLGMATDQGKTSNLNGLTLMAAITGRAVSEVGTTTYRPPYTPVPLTAFAGPTSGALMNPVRRLPLESQHRADAAVLQDYGGWLRPAYYGHGDAETEIAREALKARQSVALFDGSSLGKLEVIGPDAAAFVNFMYCNTMSTLKPGRCRFGFLLSEAGIVFDDSVLFRLAEDRFIVSCSSSHISAVHALLEEWRQDRFDRRRVFIHDATSETATLTVSGPSSRRLLEIIGLGVAPDGADLPHMAIASGTYAGLPVRIARVSFTGDRSYEISIRSDRAEILWTTLKDAGKAFDAVLLGVEALMILRAEKGNIVVGKDSDGTTRPHDLGFGTALSNKAAEFVGRRSLFTEDATRSDRRQLVGLRVADGETPLATGAHGVEVVDGRSRSLGYVTSSYASPSLGRAIALALIERGASRHGETIEILHLGQRRRATITAPCFLDPAKEGPHA
jgi:sarcosine oxidase subunit alpha